MSVHRPAPDEAQAIATLASGVAELLGVIRAQLERTASFVETEAVSLGQEVVSLHELVRRHRDNASVVFDRLLTMRSLPGISTELDQHREALLDEIFAPGVSAELVAQFHEHRRDLTSLEAHEREHAELVGRTRPMMTSLQMFDWLRQLIEHSAEALELVVGILAPRAGLPTGEGLSQALAAIATARQLQLGAIYWSDEEQRTLAGALGASDAGR